MSRYCSGAAITSDAVTMRSIVGKLLSESESLFVRRARAGFASGSTTAPRSSAGAVATGFFASSSRKVSKS